MKKVIFGCLLMLVATPCISQPSLTKVRHLYMQAATHEKACRTLIERLDEYENNPLILGYRGVAVMMMAEHVWAPFKKLSYFNKGKKMVNKAIKKAKMNAELRFLRLTAQLHAPGFLGYNDYINSDKKYLLRLLQKTENSSLKKYIIPKLKQFNVFGKKKLMKIKG